MSSDDDFYEKFQCSGGFWHNIHTSLLYSDGGNIFLGVSRVFSFILVFGLNWYNRRLLRTKAHENVNVIPGLVLPYYFLYIYLYIGLSLIAGIIDFSTHGAPNAEVASNWIIPIEQGLFHWLYEGLAIFLMRYGAGVAAIRKSLLYSFLWGIITFITYFYIYSISDSSYGQTQDKNNAFSIFLSYQAALFAFYSLFFLFPSSVLYRRPALEFYAKFNLILYGTTLIVGSIVDSDDTDAVCAGSVFIFLEVAFVQPLVLFKTFQIDSQYWQGLKPEKGNPLAEVWDHVDIRTAETMAERLEEFNVERNLPILHFGLLDFDQNNQFVAGGFSRVYFGRYRQEKVAFKILFAMELTPDDVSDFYREASLLASLKHENIVKCHGICVMPPALTMVLEHCIYGSLYDFLYKPLKDRQSSNSTRSISGIGSRIFSFFTESLLGAHNNPLKHHNKDTTTPGQHPHLQHNRNSSIEHVQQQPYRPSFVRPPANNSFFGRIFGGGGGGGAGGGPITGDGKVVGEKYIRETSVNPLFHRPSTTTSSNNANNVLSTFPPPDPKSTHHNSSPRSQQQKQQLEESKLPAMSVDSVSGSNNNSLFVPLDISKLGAGPSSESNSMSGKHRNSSNLSRGSRSVSEHTGGAACESDGGGTGTSLSAANGQELRNSLLPGNLSESEQRPSLSQQKQPSKQLATPTSRLSAMQVSSSIINDSHEIHHDGSMSGPLGRGTLGGNEGGNDYQTRESSTSRLSVLQRVSGIFANFGTSFAAGPGRGRNSSVSANGGISENDDSIMLSIAHSVPFEIRLKMMKDAVAGIQFMHSKGFMHCDIKSLNFLVDEVSSFLLCFFV
jgi:hypothetical protein